MFKVIVVKKIYVILSYSGSNFAKFLKLFTKEKYVHTTISFDKDLNKAYSFGRKYVYTPLPGGFIQENFHKNCSYFKNYISKVYELDITDEQYNNLQKDLEENFINQINKYKYNIIGLYFIWRNKKMHRKYHFVCTQFCAKVLIDNKIIDFNKDYSLIKPKDFLDLDILHLIFEGKTIDYLKRIPN